MRKSSVLVFVFALVMSMMAFPATAAEVNEKSWADSDCGEGSIGTYHFVLNKWVESNQTLTVDFGDGSTETATPYKETKGVQHFEVMGEGGIVSANTDGQGFLVLSDYECDEGKKDPDPKK